METFFAVCQPGLESVLSNEIAGLGLAAGDGAGVAGGGARRLTRGGGG